MLNNNYQKIFIITFLAILSFTSAHPSFASEVIIIANKNVPDTSLKKTELRNIFLGDKSSWTNGEKIHFVILRKGTIHDAFLDTYIKKTPKNFIRYWKRQILTGKAIVPVLVDDESKIINYVKHTEGAIGYVSNGLDINDLKILRIQ